jgi:hypothetical protein
MLSRTYFESQGKPIYSIERIITGRAQKSEVSGQH